MSSQIRSVNKDKPRSQQPQSSRRQEWVPRGSTAVATPSSGNADIKSGNGGESSQNTAYLDGQHRGNGAPADDWRKGNAAPADDWRRGAAAPGDDWRRGNSAPQRHARRPLNPRKQKEGSYEKNGQKDLNLPQLLQEIQEKLTKGTVECMICYDMVRRTAAIWSCTSCYSIFHLNCIKKWARAPTSVDLSAEKNQGFNWRCPGCQAVQLTTSKDIQYVCFCRKRIDPPSDLYLTPHSCGEPCGKPLQREVEGQGVGKEDICPHLCVLQCHPGPCPPCKAFAPPRVCPCGKKILTTRCSDWKSILTCGQRCDKLLQCSRHRCDRICHVGPCNPCDILVDALCFCKKKVETVHCGEMMVKGEVKAEEGVFSCSSICGNKLKCGNHDCGEICHPGLCGECDSMPSKINTCPCGKTSLLQERQNCLDPIPTCSETCGKRLPCGMHQCKEKCHVGDCPPCLVLVTQKCRCGSTSRAVECYKTMMNGEKFTCEKPCGQKKNCGRHRCSERCCPLSNSKNSLCGDWDPHLCSMACGKKLRCGQHSCESLCHSGHCPPCLETIFTDLTCACGRTSIPPPQPCGTPPPSCQLTCSVPQPCGHAASHSCHFGDCPPCSVPVAKECIGGHVVLRNIPCGSKDIKCNKICGKTRQCGLHACARTCHSQPCDSFGNSGSRQKASCGQTCGAPRRDCRHTCTAPCHPSSPCPEVRCDFTTTITCSCGRITATVPCDAGSSSSSVGYNLDNVMEASVVQKLPVPLQPVEATGKKIPLGQRKLMCDDDCAKAERKRVLADAFDIIPPNLDAFHFGENSLVSEMVSDLFRRDPKWVLSVEERCKFLVLGKSRGSNNGGLRVHVFCPMLKEKRDAVKLIAERWKLSVNAAGWEPRRFLVIHVTPKSKAPTRMLGPKISNPISASHPPTFDPLVDMDPRLVVALLDLPGDADVSALVLRFGGECELAWLNDKNAVAVFGDRARAATAMRRLDNGSVYHGASQILQNSGSSTTSVWGGAGMATDRGALTIGNPWKKAAVKEAGWMESSWGAEDFPSDPAAVHVQHTWKGKEAAITVSHNRWAVLESETAQVSAAAPAPPPAAAAIASSSRNEDQQIGRNHDSAEASAAITVNSELLPVGGETDEVVDNWEEACD